MTARVTSSASLSVGMIPTSGRHGASCGEAFSASSILTYSAVARVSRFVFTQRSWAPSRHVRRRSLGLSHLGWPAVNVFDERLGAPSSPRSLGWYWLRIIAQDLASPGRAALAVMVVFVLLATSGWTAMRRQKAAEDPSTTAVSAWLHGSIAGHKLPNPDAGTAAISRFFSSLSNAQRLHLADHYPLVVGNLGGAPIPLRYEANRIALGQAKEKAEKDSHSSD